MAKVILLNSGGLDSGLIGKWLKLQGTDEVHSLHIGTQLINNVQAREAAQTTATNYCASHTVIELDFGYIPNHWAFSGKPAEATPEDIAFYGTTWPYIKMYEDVADPAAAYAARPFYEFRTMRGQIVLFPAIAQNFAGKIGATKIYYGERVADFPGQWYNLTAMFLSYGNRNAERVSTYQTPLRSFTSYQDAIENGLGINMTPARWAALRTEMAYTHSCRWPVPCGICEKCTGRTNIGMTL